ncbi:DUF6895 family protein [Saccharopolyspora hattusasensis]|uniref:DUF6895 family protein n=1 Tax=Saccharopolyspora hattusasensis TaxID=1128679 RepID=UPI003D96900F
MRDAVVVRHAPIAQDFDESAVLDGALDWLGVHLVWFEPDTWDAYFPPRAFPGTTILELLLLCRSLRRGPQAAHHDEFVEAALDIADRVVHHEEFRTDLSEVDIQFPYRLWLLGLMHRLGRSPREPLAAAQKLVDALYGDPGSDIGSARGRLEVGYALELCELRHAMPERAELYGACGVADLDPASATEEDAYEFTHILFYATDMAARSLPFRDAAERDKLAAAVHSMLAGFLAAEHFDLTAELLLCAEIVGISGAPAVLEGWRGLAAAQLDGGAIPGPPFRPEVLAQRTEDRAVTYVFRTCYHPTLVTALAAVERQRRRRGAGR